METAMLTYPTIAEPAEPTPAEWEQLICYWLAVHLPVRSRWVQEHPKRAEVMRELVEEATEMLDQVNDPQEDTENPVFWASIPIPDRPDEVVAIMIDQVDLWVGIDSCWPNPPHPTAPLPPPLPGTIPASAPIRRGWSPTA
jgi:hypothetical protein